MFDLQSFVIACLLALRVYYANFRKINNFVLIHTVNKLFSIAFKLISK